MQTACVSHHRVEVELLIKQFMCDTLDVCAKSKETPRKIKV